MKKTLQEEKNRILEISRKINELYDAPTAVAEDDKETEEPVQQETDEYHDQFNKNMSQGFGELEDNKEEEEPVQQETDEYHERYNKNMSQGFKLDEDNEFVDAAKKAITEGKDTFELEGKKYRVTLSKSKK
jgi:23S rRNA pseudoU1915 N3-methylase RlmH